MYKRTKVLFTLVLALLLVGILTNCASISQMSGSGTINSQTSKELFFNQEAILLFGGSWDLQTVSNSAYFNWDVFAVPAPRGTKTYVIFQPDVGIGVNRESPHTEEALMFANWLLSK